MATFDPKTKTVHLSPRDYQKRNQRGVAWRLDHPTINRRETRETKTPAFKSYIGGIISNPDRALWSLREREYDIELLRLRVAAELYLSRRRVIKVYTTSRGVEVMPVTGDPGYWRKMLATELYDLRQYKMILKLAGVIG